MFQCGSLDSSLNIIYTAIVHCEEYDVREILWGLALACTISCSSVACIMKRYIQQVLSECHAFFQYVHITLWTWDEVIDDHAVAKKPQGHQAPPVA